MNKNNNMKLEEALETIIESAREEALTQKFEEMFDKYDKIVYAIDVVEKWMSKNLDIN
jgi:uncharacterized protein YutD